MEKGKLKISKSRRLELTIGKASISIPKIFVFDHLEPGSYECEIERDKGAVLRILVNGKDIPRDEEAILKKQTQASEKEAKDKHEKDLIKMYEQQENSGDSYVLEKALVPLDTRKTLLYDSDNFHLKLNRFARFENVKGDEKFYFFNPKKREERDRQTNEKRTLLNEFEIHENYGQTNFPQITTRAADHAAILLGKDNLVPRIFTPNWRLIVGLGGESVYETSITLHHIYGFPYIPASSIKGVLRSFIIAEVFGSQESVNNSTSKQDGEEDYPLLNAEFRALTESEDFCKIFGCPNQADRVEFSKGQPIINNDKRYKTKAYPVALRKREKPLEGEAHQGKVIFFDALPTKAPNIQPDIMNPHYGDWYGNKKDNRGNPIAPTDTQSPVPVFFLTVEGTPFQFLFGSKKIPDITTQTFWGKTLGDWLEAALTQRGIGAKTAVGYGVMINSK